MSVATDFRKGVRDLVADAAKIKVVIDGEREGVSDDDVVACWTTESRANETNTLFRLVSVTARVILGRDAEVGPDDDDPLDTMEEVEADVLASVPSFIAGTRVASVDVAHDPNTGSLDFIFVGEYENPAPEV